MSKLHPVDPVVIENLLLGACPERRDDIQQSWREFQPKFYVKPDAVGADLSAGENRISWMHKTFAIDWVIATLGLQALTAYGPHILFAQMFNVPISAQGISQDDRLASLESQMDEAVYFARMLWRAEDPSALDWPSSIAVPGSFPDASHDPIGKANFDLACLAAAATFFHELRHVQFAVANDGSALPIEEERACDDYARRMVLDRVQDYCNQTGEPYVQVLNKRIMGLATAALCIAHAEPVGMRAAITNSHPPLKERFELLVINSNADEDSLAWDFVGSVLIHLLRSQNRLPESLTVSSVKGLCRQLVDLL